MATYEITYNHAAGGNKISESFARRVREAGQCGYTRGAYTYRYDAATGGILRCATDEVGRAWLDADGNQRDGWQLVSR